MPDRDKRTDPLSSFRTSFLGGVVGWVREIRPDIDTNQPEFDALVGLSAMTIITNALSSLPGFDKREFYIECARTARENAEDDLVVALDSAVLMLGNDFIHRLEVARSNYFVFSD